MAGNGHKLLAAGSTVLVSEPALALAHQGGVGIIAGLLLGAIAYEAAGGIGKVTGKEISLPVHTRSADKPSVMRRMMSGKSVRAAREQTAKQEEIDEMEELQPRPIDTNDLPRRSPVFAQMQHLITPGKDILGFDGNQFISADALKQSVNIALIGVPSAGKTVCLTFHVAQAVLRNAIVRGWDLHGDVAADLGDCFNILEDVDDIVNDCEWIQAERERRLALRKRAKSGDRNALRQWNETRELFYIVDEFNALMLRLKQRKPDREFVADTLLSLIAEGRKFKMRCIIAGQTMPAALFGEGGSSARDIINTKYAFQSRENHAQYFGIEQKSIDALLPRISGKDSAGYAILDGGPLLHAAIVSIPLTTVEDIRSLVKEYESEEDDVVAYTMQSRSQRKPRTDELPAVPATPRRHHAMSGYEAHRQRKEQHRPAVYVAAREQERVTTKSELDMALEAYDAGNTTLDALAVAMNKTSWTVRPLYAQVKKLRS